MLDPGSLPTTTAPDLATLRAQLQAALATHPELHRELRQAITGIDRRLGLATAPTATQRHNRSRLGYTDSTQEE